MALRNSFRFFPKERDSIALIIASYGWVEFILAYCVGHAIGGEQHGLRTIFRLNSNEARIDTAESLLLPICDQLGHREKHKEVILAVKFCKSIRNQFAHAHFEGIQKVHGLFFSTMAEATVDDFKFNYFFRHVDVHLLKQQEAYFEYTIACLQFIQDEIRVATGADSTGHVTPWPTKISQPLKHNLPTKHVPPPWLLEDRRQRHKEATEEWERAAGLRPPEPRKRKSSAAERRKQAIEKHGKSSSAHACSRIRHRINHLSQHDLAKVLILQAFVARVSTI
jgi:hypothetical protein